MIQLISKTLRRIRPSRRRVLALIVVEVCAVLFLLRPGLLRPDTSFNVQTKVQTAERWGTVLPVAFIFIASVTLLAVLINRENRWRAVNSLGFCMFGLMCAGLFLPFFSVHRGRDQFRSEVALLAFVCTLIVTGWALGLFVIRAWKCRQRNNAEFQYSLEEVVAILVALGLAFSLWLMFIWLPEWPTW